MNRVRPAKMVISLTVSLVLGACASNANVESSADTAEPDNISMHGLQIEMEHLDLANAADVVIVGTAADMTVERFSDNAEVPPEDRNEPGFEHSTYQQVTVTVDEVLHGQLPAGARTVGVARLQTFGIGDGTQLEVEDDRDVALESGEQYVLFVSEGQQVWTGKFIALGAQGVGDVDGETVRFRDGRTTTLEELRDVLGAAL